MATRSTITRTLPLDGSRASRRPPGSRATRLLPGLLLIATAFGLAGCKTYTAYLHLEPEKSAPKKLNDAQRRRADDIVASVLVEHGFIRDPKQSRLQQKSRTSVQYDYSVISSYVPKGAVTGNRLTIATVVRKTNGRFAVLIRDLSSGEASPLVVAIRKDLGEAFAEGVPGYRLEMERRRFGPRGAY